MQRKPRQKTTKETQKEPPLLTTGGQCTVKIKSKIVDTVSETIYLGVYIDNSLNWETR